MVCVVIHTVICFHLVKGSSLIGFGLGVLEFLQRSHLVSLGLHLLGTKHFLCKELVIVQFQLLLLYLVLEKNKLVCGTEIDPPLE